MEEFIVKSKSWFGDNFSGLLESIKKYAKKVGRVAARPLVTLYFVLDDDNSSETDKILILAALVYTVIPGDLIPFRKWGLLGWLDDGVSVAYAYKKMQRLITQQIRFDVERVLDQWFEGVGLADNN